MIHKRRVWVTRAQPGAGETAGRLKALGVVAHVAPLLTVEPLATTLDLEGVGALAFTSRNGVDAFIAGHAAEGAAHRLRIYAVGDATADHARGAGFGEVISADGDVATLADRIQADAPAGRILHLGPEETAGDLIGALNAAGFDARFLPIYRTVPTAVLDPSTLNALAAGALTDVLLHSPRAAAQLARRLRPDQTEPLSAWALSPACLEPLAKHSFRSRTAAARPREDALLATLGAALGISPKPR